MLSASPSPPLIVIDEQSAWGEILEIRMVLHILLVEGEVISSCQGIGRTATQVALVKDWEATILGTQVHHLFRSLLFLADLFGCLFCDRKGHVQVTMIWDIRNPTHLFRAGQGHGLHPGIPGGKWWLKRRCSYHCTTHQQKNLWDICPVTRWQEPGGVGDDLGIAGRLALTSSHDFNAKVDSECERSGFQPACCSDVCHARCN